MIGKAIIGGSFGGCVNYCLDEKKEPEILGSNGICEGTNTSIIHQFKLIKEQSPAVEKPVWHSTISFAHQDEVDNQKMQQIAKEYLEEMKLGENQYLIVKHNDTEHSHVHIIINRVGFDGKLARDWKCRYKTKKIMQMLEKRHGLIVAKDQENKRKVKIKQQIEAGLSNKENLNQIFDRVEKLGYEIEYNKTKEGKIRGVGFRNKQKAIYFKSSSIDRKFSYSKLLKATAKIVTQFKSKQIAR